MFIAGSISGKDIKVTLEQDEDDVIIYFEDGNDQEMVGCITFVEDGKNIFSLYRESLKTFNTVGKLE